MKSDNNISKDLQSDEGFLSNIKKENNFTTPSNYFDELPELLNNKRVNSSSLNLNKLLYRILIPSATFIIITVLILNWNNSTEITQISDDQLSEYIINEEYESFDEQIIYDIYMESIALESNLEEVEENYINYLIDNDVDINTIIEEL